MDKFDLKVLSNRELSQLQEQILIERRRRMESSSTAIALPPDASPSDHEQAIRAILNRQRSL